jgi:hypothetical protein
MVSPPNNGTCDEKFVRVTKYGHVEKSSPIAPSEASTDLVS